MNRQATLNVTGERVTVDVGEVSNNSTSMLESSGVVEDSIAPTKVVEDSIVPARMESNNKSTKGIPSLSSSSEDPSLKSAPKSVEVTVNSYVPAYDPELDPALMYSSEVANEKDTERKQQSIVNQDLTSRIKSKEEVNQELADSTILNENRNNIVRHVFNAKTISPSKSVDELVNDAVTYAGVSSDSPEGAEAVKAIEKLVVGTFQNNEQFSKLAERANYFKSIYEKKYTGDGSLVESISSFLDPASRAMAIKQQEDNVGEVLNSMLNNKELNKLNMYISPNTGKIVMDDPYGNPVEVEDRRGVMGVVSDIATSMLVDTTAMLLVSAFIPAVGPAVVGASAVYKGVKYGGAFVRYLASALGGGALSGTAQSAYRAVVASEASSKDSLSVGTEYFKETLYPSVKSGIYDQAVGTLAFSTASVLGSKAFKMLKGKSTQTTAQKMMSVDPSLTLEPLNRMSLEASDITKKGLADTVNLINSRSSLVNNLSTGVSEGKDVAYAFKSIAKEESLNYKPLNELSKAVQSLGVDINYSSLTDPTNKNADFNTAIIQELKRTNSVDDLSSLEGITTAKAVIEDAVSKGNMQVSIGESSITLNLGNTKDFLSQIEKISSAPYNSLIPESRKIVTDSVISSYKDPVKVKSSSQLLDIETAILHQIKSSPELSEEAIVSSVMRSNGIRESLFEPLLEVASNRSFSVGALEKYKNTADSFFSSANKALNTIVQNTDSSLSQKDLLNYVKNVDLVQSPAISSQQLKAFNELKIRHEDKQEMLDSLSNSFLDQLITKNSSSVSGTANGVVDTKKVYQYLAKTLSSIEKPPRKLVEAEKVTRQLSYLADDASLASLSVQNQRNYKDLISDFATNIVSRVITGATSSMVFWRPVKAVSSKGDIISGKIAGNKIITDDLASSYAKGNYDITVQDILNGYKAELTPKSNSNIFSPVFKSSSAHQASSILAEQFKLSKEISEGNTYNEPMYVLDVNGKILGTSTELDILQGKSEFKGLNKKMNSIADRDTAVDIIKRTLDDWLNMNPLSASNSNDYALIHNYINRKELTNEDLQVLLDFPSVKSMLPRYGVSGVYGSDNTIIPLMGISDE